MSQLPPSALERRSGVDRRQAPAAAGATSASSDPGGVVRPPRSASPFVLPQTIEAARTRDPWVSVVTRAIADYRDRRIDDLARSWDEAVTWHVVAGWPGADAEALADVQAYHRSARDLTSGTFRQEVVSLDASGGPIVVGHVRTQARRRGRRLDTPTLLTFELVAMRIRRVTEIPGDRAEWDAFWAG